MLGAVRDYFIVPRMTRPATDGRALQASRPLLLPVLLVLLSTAGPGSQSWAASCNMTAPSRVNNSTDILMLKTAVDCSDGGEVIVDWGDSIINITEPISIGPGTFLSITGENKQAEVRGDATRMFDVSEGASLSLTRLKLSGGMEYRGGVIQSYKANLTLDSCVFDGNSASAGHGGAVWAQGGQITISGGTFSNNNAAGFGGALFANNTDLTICNGTRFEDNKAAQGGALYGNGLRSCVLRNATFVSNNASHEMDIDTDEDYNTFEGGGAAAFDDAEVDLSDCLFAGNVAQLSGGAVFGGTAAVLTINGSTFRNNYASAHGGGIAASSATLGGGTELVYNVAGMDGGAIYCSGNSDGLEGSQVTIEGGSLSNNKALEAGGAISARGKSTVVTVAGGTFERNKAKYYGGFVFLKEEASFSCERGTLKNNYAGNQGGGIYAREATWVDSSCGMIGNEAQEGAAAYVIHVGGGVNLQSSEIAGNPAWSGNLFFVAHSRVIAREATFKSRVGVINQATNTAIQLDVNSSFLCQDCVFNGWLGDTVIYNANAASGSLVLNSCDFSGSSATMAVISPFSDAEIRNAVVGDETLVNAESLDPLQLVDRSVNCSDTNACGEDGECVDSALGVLCECLPQSDECLDDGGTISLTLTSPPDTVTYSPSAVEFKLLVSATDDGTTDVIWSLIGVGDLSLTVVPRSGILRPGGNATVTATGTPTRDDVDGNMTSRLVLTSVGSGCNGTPTSQTEGGKTALNVSSTFYLCPTFQYAFPVDDDDRAANFVCKQCAGVGGFEGVDCEKEGATLASLPIREGYWRSSRESLVIHLCSHSEACAGAMEVSSSDDYCADGYKGPYCAVCAEDFGRGAGRSCHSCTGSKSRVLNAAGAIFSVVVVIGFVFAVAFLVGGLDAIGGVRRSLFHLASISSSSKQKTSFRRSRGTNNNRDHGAASGSPQPATQFFSPSEAMQAGHGSGNHQDGVVSPSARLYPNLLGSWDDEIECKHDDREVHETVLTFQDSGCKVMPAKADTAGVVCPRRAITSPIFDAVAPGSFRRVGPSLMLGCSTGAATLHGGKREAEAETAESAWGRNNGRFGGYRLFGEKMKNWISRLPFGKLKILVVVWQILTVFPTITAVDFPPFYSRFLAWIGLVNFDLGQILSSSCLLPSITFYERLLLTTLAPIMLAGVLVLTYQVAKRTAGIGSRGVIARRTAWSRHMAAGLLLSFLVFTSASTTVFQTFACDSEAVQGENYLRADYRLSCKSDKHTFFMAYAGIMILVYPIGIPLLYFFILWTNRHSLNPRVCMEQDNLAELEQPLSAAERQDIAGGYFTNRARTDGEEHQQPMTAVSAEFAHEFEELVRKRKRDPALVPSMFLWKYVGPDMYYYEVIECGRRILLTGLLIFIAPNTATQMASACIFAFASLLVFEVLYPHVDPTDSWLYRMGGVVIFLNNFLALLVKMDAVGEKQRAVFAGLLVAINISFVLAVLSMSWFATQQKLDDSCDEGNVLYMAEGLSTESRRMLTRRRVSPALGSVSANSGRFGGALYAASVDPIRVAIGGRYGSSGGSYCHEESNSARGARASAHTASGECIVARPGSLSSALLSGRQVIRGGSEAEIMHLSGSGGDSSERSEPDKMALSPSAGPGPPPMSRLRATSSRKMMNE